MNVGESRAARTLETDRLRLEPLRTEHADEMQPLLDDPGLHEFIGGEPAALDDLRARYARQTVGQSSDGSQRWFNWVLRRRDTGEVAGTVQATVSDEDGGLTGEIAWVVGASQQGHGYAKEAAGAMADWLRQEGVDVLIAHVHPNHAASVAVARAVGLDPTDTVVDGEIRWQDGGSG
jgi:RimJ/RimL family protein N-acetyltransferase